MDNHIRTQLLDEVQQALAVPNIQFMMPEFRDGRLQTSLIPAGITLRAKENRSLVVVYAMDFESLKIEKRANLRTDQPRRTSDQYLLHKQESGLPLPSVCGPGHKEQLQFTITSNTRNAAGLAGRVAGHD
jgi:hypothetical protein